MAIWYITWFDPRKLRFLLASKLRRGDWGRAPLADLSLVTFVIMMVIKNGEAHWDHDMIVSWYWVCPLQPSLQLFWHNYISQKTWHLTPISFHRALFHIKLKSSPSKLPCLQDKNIHHDYQVECQRESSGCWFCHTWTWLAPPQPSQCHFK